MWVHVYVYVYVFWPHIEINAADCRQTQKLDSQTVVSQELQKLTFSLRKRCSSRLLMAPCLVWRT